MDESYEIYISDGLERELSEDFHGKMKTINMFEEKNLCCRGFNGKMKLTLIEDVWEK